MIHDIDILLSIVNSPVKKIQANGISIITDSIDIAHARIKFQNNTVASITSSRIAKEDIRKVKLFQRDLYCTIDLLLGCLLYTSPSPRDQRGSRMPSSA